MVLIKIYGLDQFVVGNYAKENTSNIAKLLETKDEEIMFYAPNSMIFHKGVEQTSWNAVVEIMLEEKYHDLEENISKYIGKTLNLFSINLHVIFNYYHPHHLHEYFNNEYPRFIKDDNLVKVEEENLEEVNITNEEEVYTGNIFKDFEKKNK